MYVRIHDCPVGLVVSLEWIGDELTGAFKHLQGIAKHKHGADPLPTSGRAADLAGNGDSAVEGLGPNPVRELHEIRNDQFFEVRFHLSHNNQVCLAGVDVLTYCTDDEFTSPASARASYVPGVAVAAMIRY